MRATIVERADPKRPGVWLGFIVPNEAVEAIAGELARSRRRIPVEVTLGEVGYRTSLLCRPDGWEFIASLWFRAKTGTAQGDTIEVDVAYDPDERDVDVPPELEAGLDATPGAREWWDGLSYSRRREAVLYVTDAKTSEGRARRVKTALSRVGGRA